MAFNPYDLYGQDPRNQVFGAGSVPYQTSPALFDDSEQRQSFADLLRQGNQQPQQQGSAGSPIDAKTAKGVVDWMGSFGGSGLPNSSQNAMTNAVTPNFQSGNYGAPDMTMTGANQITPSFQTANFQSPEMMQQGFNPSMFKGMF